MRLAQWVFLCLFLHFAGCARLTLTEHDCPPSGQWRMFGGSPQRQNFTPWGLRPPMAREWEYDASAGFGPYGVTVCGNVIIAGNLRGEIHLIDGMTGDGIGVKDFGDAVFSPPVFDGGILYVPVSDDDGGLTAYDLREGSVLWKNKTGRIENALLLLEDRVIVSTVSDGICAIDKKGGSILWRYRHGRGGGPTTGGSTPAGSGKMVLFGTEDGYVTALNSDDGKPLWQIKAGENVAASPVIKDNELFVGTLEGKMLSLDLSTGETVWMTEIGSAVHCAVAVGDSNIFAATASGEIVSLRKENGKPSWRFDTGGVLGCAPLLAGDVLYIGSLDKNLYCLDAVSGELLWKYRAGGRIISAPVAYDGRIILMSDDNLIFALKPEAKER